LTLGISFENAFQNINEQRFGRMKRLQNLGTQIVDPQRYGPAHYQLVEDCIEAALLDRGLGATRDECRAVSNELSLGKNMVPGSTAREVP
jgi:hypothetical protein